MTFAVEAEAYDRHVGRYASALAHALVDASALSGTGVEAVLDVGSGPGALTAVLAERLLGVHVAAVDPSEPFVQAIRRRLPAVNARVAAAEALPFTDDSFDAAFSQLVVNFMADPERGLMEMRRVVRPDGSVVAAVWDYGGEMTLLRVFWEAAAACFPTSAAPADERVTMAFARPGELENLFLRTGLTDIRHGALVVEASYESFDDLWAPLEQGVAPSGAFVASLSAPDRDALREEFHRRLGSPTGSFALSARAWYSVGTV